MKKNTLVILLVLVAHHLYGQSSLEFKKLLSNAFSAYENKNYKLSASNLDQALALPPNQKSEITGSSYYNMACIYALNKEKSKALDCLNRSFQVSHAKEKRYPVGASHVLEGDTDLAFLRGTVEFQDFALKYFDANVVKFHLVREISYEDLLAYIINYPPVRNGQIEINNKVIYSQKADSGYVYNSKFRTLQFPNAENLTHRPLIFSNCTFKMNLIWANFNHSKQQFPYEVFEFRNCVFEGRVVFSEMSFTSSPKFFKCTFSEDLYLHLNASKEYYRGFTIDSCNLKNVIGGINTTGPSTFSNNFSSDSSQILIEISGSSKVNFVGNNLAKNTILFSGGELPKLLVSNNSFDNLIIHTTKINTEFDYHTNSLSGKLLLFETYLTNDPVNDIQWSVLSNRLGYLKNIPQGQDGYIVGSNERVGRLSELTGSKGSVRDYGFISGESISDISSDQSFIQLMGMYSMFLNLYKNKNDIESYNSCFVAIKELQSKRLKYLFETNRTFESFFRWKLSQLLRFYVLYGTDPARAIVISIYIILIFGFFYFFFPSDWDKKSKKQLVQNFKDFIQKNEKGYVMPFFVLLAGFFMSLLNAITLSLNAFITLGFGNIPTYGVARYFCILEGFFGWFLLSIFTVALINQVL